MRRAIALLQAVQACAPRPTAQAGRRAALMTAATGGSLFGIPGLKQPQDYLRWSADAKAR